ncbi:hypothetical protein GEMRC1_010778 [Eukaryota sp. GEM-RC1]
MLSRKTGDFLLKSLQLQSTVVSDGSEAVAEYYNDPLKWDCIFLDHRMPMSGPDTCQRIRTFEELNGIEPVLIIGLTADVLEETRQECLTSGMNAFLTKPLKRRTCLFCWNHFFRPLLEDGVKRDIVYQNGHITTKTSNCWTE